MIRYALACSRGHAFEAWFRSSDAYERQARRRLVVCPECGSHEVEKQPMAPAVITRGRAAVRDQSRVEAPPPQVSAPISDAIAPLEMLRAFKRHVMENSEDVGQGFAEEARRIHHGESEARAIRGETSGEEAAKLTEEGIAFGVLPRLPEDHN